MTVHAVMAAAAESREREIDGSASRGVPMDLPLREPVEDSHILPNERRVTGESAVGLRRVYLGLAGEGT
ncbi:MAG: hypothetical protein JXA57_09645 [Armatimonadetes bacterium]|nr:hypothetical protein [Armatimonadota bacterium]